MRTLGLVMLSSVIYAVACADSSSTEEKASLSGLWTYRTISHGGAAELVNRGLFLFHNGEFFQHSIDEGADWNETMGQAHVGTYTVADDIVYFEVKLGIIVLPGADPVLAVRRDGKNHAAISRDNELLKLSFDENTVQVLEKLESGKTEIHRFDTGYLVLTGNKFILTHLNDNGFHSASGDIVKDGLQYTLHANPYISVIGERVEYSKDLKIQFSKHEGILILANGKNLQVKTP